MVQCWKYNPFSTPVISTSNLICMDAIVITSHLTGMMTRKLSLRFLHFHLCECDNQPWSSEHSYLDVIQQVISTNVSSKKKLSSIKHIPLRIMGYSPLFVPPAPDVGPGDETTARYVGGGGGGGVLRLP